MRLHLSSRQVVRAAAAVGAVAFAGGALAAGRAVTTIRLTSSGPDPATVTVAVGDTLSFANADTDNHSVLSSGAGIVSPVIRPGETWTRTMGAPGKFPFVQTGFGKSYHGTIVVAVKGDLTIKLSAQQVVVGGAVRLTGSSPLPDYDVALESRAATARSSSSASAGGGWTPVQTVHAGADGSFSATLRPQVTTRYRAEIVQAKLRSTSFQVSVAPLVVAKPAHSVVKTGTQALVRARVSPAASAKALELYTFDARRGRWHSVATSAVSAAGTAVLRWKAASGRTMLRVATDRRQLAAGLAVGTSRSFAIVGKGAAAPTKPAKPKKHRKHRP